MIPQDRQHAIQLGRYMCLPTDIEDADEVEDDINLPIPKAA
jgi:hypothetical protein